MNKPQEGESFGGADINEYLDFDSDEPLKECPLRNNGDEVCEGCQ